MVIATLIMFLVAGVMLVTIVGGAWLCWLGLRGDIVGTPPRCRGCGYDLTGRPEPGRLCPECGADTRRRGAVCTCRRRLSRGQLAAGVSLLILGTSPLTLSGCLGARAQAVSEAAPAAPPALASECVLRGRCVRGSEPCSCPFSRSRAGTVAIAGPSLACDRS